MTSPLDDWQQLLATRFSILRAERDAVRPGSPLFALEHGLSLDDELPRLQDAVRKVVLGRRLPRSVGLPFVVYAAEIGYRYRGDEFWPGFEEATPNWTSHGTDASRRFIRNQFEAFAETYGGAQISGRWAMWFKNIAWPITHAILPTDLQRHLARLLFDYRTALNADLLDDHAALGERLADRSADTSARFRNFAQNTELLGLVAAALLVGEDEDTQLLTPEVLRRIVDDLSKERQAGAWLLDAKRAAVRLRRKGWLRHGSGGRSPQQDHGESEQRLEASLSLRRTNEGWRPYVLIPTHQSLAKRLPNVRHQLEKSRYRVNGVRGTQSVGALLYDRGPMPMESWPGPDGQSLVELEDLSATQAVALLQDHCRLAPGPWLFRISEPGVAIEVRTRTVRSACDYILVSRAPVEIDEVLVESASLTTANASAIRFRVPQVLGAAEIEGLLAVGISVAPEVSVRPAALVPAVWDGEGAAEWPAGETPILAIHSSQLVSRWVVSTDSEARAFSWPEDSDTAYVQIADAVPGTHLLQIVLLDETGAPLSQGDFRVRVREPVDSSLAASARQGLQVRCFPPHPKLNDLWSGKSRLEVTGPEGERVQVEVLMTDLGGSRPLARTSFSSALPIGEERWTELLRGAQGSSQLDSFVGEAEEMVVRVEHPALGASEVRAGRPFAPIRWTTGQDSAGPFARLINHTSERPVIRYSPPDHPATVEMIDYDEEAEIRVDRGGLIVATCNDAEAAVVVSPRVSGGLEALRLLNVRPTLQTGPRTVDSVRRCISLARAWGRVAAPSDATASHIQLRVLEAIRSRLGGLIGRQTWWEVEHAVVDGAVPTAPLLLSGLSRDSRDELRIGEDLLNARKRSDEGERDADDCFVTAVALEHRWIEHSAARLVLRLAERPESLDEADTQVIEAIEATLNRPATFRLARLVAMSKSIGIDRASVGE